MVKSKHFILDSGLKYLSCIQLMMDTKRSSLPFWSTHYMACDMHHRLPAICQGALISCDRCTWVPVVVQVGYCLTREPTLMNGFTRFTSIVDKWDSYHRIVLVDPVCAG